MWRLGFLTVCVLCSLGSDAPGPVIEDQAFIATLDQTEQRYVVLTPPTVVEPLDVLIALHGHGSDRWQFVKAERDECRAARDAAIQRGMLYVSPDYRAKTSWMGPAAEADLVQLIELLKRERSVRHVYLCGGSMGGTGALTFAALHPDLIAGVASMNGTANLVEYENFQDAIRESFGGDKQTVPEEYRKRSAELQVEALRMPVGLTTGGMDTAVPPASVLRLAEKLKILDRRVLLVHRESGGHETNYEDATKILDFVLPPKSTTD